MSTAGNVVPISAAPIEVWVIRARTSLPPGFPERVEIVPEGASSFSTWTWWPQATEAETELFWSLGAARAHVREVLGTNDNLYSVLRPGLRAL